MDVDCGCTRMLTRGRRGNGVAFLLAVLAGVVLLTAGGCDSGAKYQGTYQGSYPIRVVCTTGMVADLVRNVGGAHVEVTQLMGAGIDPHLYKASPGDVRLLSEADMIFYSGRNLEGKMGDVFVRMARKKPTVAVADGIDDGQVLEDEEEHFDPHLWFNVALWSQGVDVVRDALAQHDPKHAGEYRENAASYRERLKKLDDWVRGEIKEKIPPERRVLATAHDAFQYFGKAYGMEVLAIQGISTESEASTRKVADLARTLAQRKIKAVFVESSVPEKYVKALVEGSRNDYGHQLVIGGELYSDAMGKPGTPEGTYEGMIRYNVHTIVEALK